MGHNGEQQHEEELSPDEIEEQNAEELPDREVMSVMNPAAPVHDNVIPPPPPDG